MFEDLGQSFMPRGPRRDDAGPGGNRLADILQTLSFRLPKFLGAGPVAPHALLDRSNRDPLASAIAEGVLGNILKGAPSTISAAAAPDAGSPSPLSNLMAPMLQPWPTAAPSPRPQTSQGAAPPLPQVTPDVTPTTLPSAPAPYFDVMNPPSFENSVGDIRAQLGGRRRQGI